MTVQGGKVGLSVALEVGIAKHLNLLKPSKKIPELLPYDDPEYEPEELKEAGKLKNSKKIDIQLDIIW